MKCRRIEESLPLFVSGDLSRRKERVVADHLSGCPDCDTQAAEYRESRAWLQTQGHLDLGESAFDDLRGQVLRRIRAHPAQSGVRDLRFILAVVVTFFVIAAGILVYLSKRDSGTEQRSAPDLVENPARPAPREPDRAERAAASTRVSEKRRPSRRGSRSSPTEPVVATAAVPQAPAFVSSVADAASSEEDETDTLRIEIQTSDPNIRIIWFARLSGKPSVQTE